MSVRFISDCVGCDWHTCVGCPYEHPTAHLFCDTCQSEISKGWMLEGDLYCTDCLIQHLISIMDINDYFNYYDIDWVDFDNDEDVARRWLSKVEDSQAILEYAENEMKLEIDPATPSDFENFEE